MDHLDALFERLVRTAQESRPELLTRPVEVAELIEIAPYRVLRAEHVMESNEDYAHALTQLLAGERGYVFADDLLQDDLRAELAGPSPNLEAYKAYLTARVTISQEHARKVSGAPIPLAEAITAPKPVRASVVSPPASPRPLDAQAETAPRFARPGCQYCGQSLPEDRTVHFCPHCGQNLLARRCAACSAELEPGWKFCVACGRLAAS